LGQTKVLHSQKHPISYGYDFRYSSMSFVRFSWVKTTYKLAINWQNFAQVELQLKFVLRIRSLVSHFVNSYILARF